MHRGALIAAAALAVTIGHATTASAFTTRLHIVIANEVRTALVAGGGKSVALKLGSFSVTLSDADAKAIIEQPLAFRAGAIGPDNVIFPGMTDPSHAIEQHPFEQCQVLYEMAITAEERAYAIGCFLHGSTDAIAHHYVNYLTGETFTLNPITVGRMSSWSNVVRHITAEAMVQKAAYNLKASNFGAGPMGHAIPKSFVLRAYFDTKSPLWQLSSKHARAKFEATRAAKPGASLPTLVSTSGLAPAEQLVMAPLYIEEIEAGRKKLRTDIEAAIKTMQDPTSVDGSKLKVTAGADGVIGTLDDKTACTFGCGALYAKYFTYVSILKPRKDASGMLLPSAFDKISDKLGTDLRGFSPALVQTIENVSTRMNGALSPTSDGLDMSKADVAVTFTPLRDWSTALTTIDYETISRALVPDWLQKLEDLMSTAGVSVKIPDIVAALMQPVVQPIKDAVKTYVIDLAEAQIGTLIDEYKRNFATTSGEFGKRLTAVASTKGTVLASFFDSGLWAHSFNIAAAAIAKHELVLPEKGTDIGPATFDAAYTPSWMQPGVCDYLRTAIFPLGLDVKALLSIGDSPARVFDDPAVECHDGVLGAFAATPSLDNCRVVALPALMSSKRGSLSRSYPPSLGTKPACRYLKVDGLPDPPEMPAMPDTGPLPVDDAGNPIPVDDAGVPINPDEPGATPSTEEAGGCGCRASSRNANGGAFALLAIAAFVTARRRTVFLTGRRRKPAATANRGLTPAASRLIVMVGVGMLVGCSSTDTTTAEGDTDVAAETATEGDAEFDSSEPDVNVDSNVPDTAMMVDTKPEVFVPETGSPAAAMLTAIGDSVWSATQTRLGKTRAIEMRFHASTLEWGELRNPYGPARLRTYRSFTVDADGKTVQSTILSPSGWPIHPDNGKKETWTFAISGSPRKLTITSGAKTETFSEVAWPKPTTGLTAYVNVFSATGKINDAFCGTGSFSSIDRAALWEFARGKSSEKPIGTDVVAGAKLLTWIDTSGGDNFAVTDVDGFRTLGGTELTDQANFIVRYFGKVKHPGGTLKMREFDDDVKDAVWAFVGGKAGVSLSAADLFLEVHGKAAADSTADEPSATAAAGELSIEIFVLRCAAPIQKTEVQIALGTGAFQLVGNAPTVPQIDDLTFPPAL